MRGTRRDRNHRERGIVTLEAAVLVCFFLVPFGFGIVDCSRYLSAGSTVTRAVREGAVWVARGQDPLPVVQNYLQSAGLDGSRASVTLSTGADGTESGAEMVLLVQYDLTGYTVIPWETVFSENYNSRMVVRHE